MNIIGITGGIGSGKSVVSHLLRIMGYKVYDTDSAAKQLMIHNSRLRHELTDVVGVDVYNADGSLNKPVMARFVFASEQNVAKINSIVHPYVRNDFKQWTLAQPQDETVFMECAILYESGFDSLVNEVMLVYASKKTRLQRAMQRDKVDEAKIKERMDKQISDDEKLKRANIVIYNDDSRALVSQLLKQGFKYL